MGYIARHWRGEQELPLSYWVNYVLLGGIINAASVYGLFDSLYTDVFAMLAIGLFLVAILIWQFVGTWRSANQFKIDGREKKDRNPEWGTIAQFFITLPYLVIIGAFITGLF